MTLAGLVQWAGAPKWTEGDTERAAYFKQNPEGWLFNAYLNGRPGDNSYDPSKPDEFEYNWGADYNQAMKMFGGSIWDVVQTYRALPDDAAQRKAFYQANPQYLSWSEWWYSNLPSRLSQYARFGSSYGYRGGGGSRYSEKPKWLDRGRPYYPKPQSKFKWQEQPKWRPDRRLEEDIQRMIEKWSNPIRG